MTKRGIIYVIGLGLLAVVACTNEADDVTPAQQLDPGTGVVDAGAPPPSQNPTPPPTAPDPINTSIPDPNGAADSQAPVINPPLAGSSSPPPIAGSAGSQTPIAGSEAPMPIAGSEAPIAGADGGDAEITESQGGEPRPCLASPSQVVIAGDSYVGAPTMIAPRLEARAVAAGALQQGQHYRDYAIPGTTMGYPGGEGDIPRQMESAIADDPNVTTVIYSGGGNDILFVPTCVLPGTDQDEGCRQVIENVIEVSKASAEKLKQAGVRDVIYFLYPDIPAGGHDILGYGVTRAEETIPTLNNDTFQVHLIDTRPAFDGHAEYFGIDPIHPNDAGAEVIADLIWDVMVQNCIAQPASSGCCTP